MVTLTKKPEQDAISPFDGQTLDLKEPLKTAWTLIEERVGDRRSTFHLPTVASISVDGSPTIRTVVLRGVNVSERSLRFHTDRRSAKFLELTRNPRIALHFYDASIKTQIRLEAVGELHVEGSLASAAWKASQPSSRLCYAAKFGPGEEVTMPPAAPTPKDAETDDGLGNFCLVIALVHRLEWLNLEASGHQRAAFAWTKGGTLSARWLAP